MHYKDEGENNNISLPIIGEPVQLKTAYHKIANSIYLITLHDNGRPKNRLLILHPLPSEHRQLF